MGTTAGAAGAAEERTAEPPKSGPGHRWPSVVGFAVVLGLIAVALISQVWSRPQQEVPTPKPPRTSAAAQQTTPSPDATPPTDAGAQSAAETFMHDLWQRQYEHAWSETCDAGQDEFPNGAALRKSLGLDDRSIAGYTITGVSPTTFNGDRRKVVTIAVTYSPDGNGTINLSVTQQRGQPIVCGW